MKNINITYAQLRKGDKKLTNIMNELIEYKVTKGAKSYHVADIMEYPSLHNRAILMSVLCMAAYAAALILYFHLNVQHAFYPMLILAAFLVGITVMNRRAQKKYESYDDVNQVLNLMPAEEIQKAYYKYNPKNK